MVYIYIYTCICRWNSKEGYAAHVLGTHEKYKRKDPSIIAARARIMGAPVYAN